MLSDIIKSEHVVKPKPFRTSPIFQMFAMILSTVIGSAQNMSLVSHWLISVVVTTLLDTDIKQTYVAIESNRKQIDSKNTRASKLHTKQLANCFFFQYGEVFTYVNS